MLRTAPLTQPPPLQNATDTIQTLSNRLLNATLLEDRRGAILGLKSFAKQYPASVASGALRHLIGTLNKDVDDVDTGKIALETILNLFNPSDDSLETSETLALWLADEFTQRQDNIVLLLDRLDVDDFYTRLYALEILSAISSLRPQRTQECILAAPLGTTRLVAVLDERREEIQTTGLLLLIELTAGSVELQKVIAFENAFDRIFNLIQLDGSLAEGGVVVQDCLGLLANLLHLNASNQTLFRETGFVPKLAKLLKDVRYDSEDEEVDRIPEIEEKNVWGLLAVLRLFLIEGNPGCKANQLAFEKHGLLQLLLNHAFSETVGPNIRAEALKTCSDLIKGNSQVQERFAHNIVRKTSSSPLNAANGPNRAVEEVYVIDALLDATLSNPSISMFDVRAAASQCIQAYFFGHVAIKQHFLKRAIDGHTSAGGDETSNILTILIQGPQSSSAADPYRLWFAAELCTQLLFENPEAKNMTMAISEGDAASGEDVITCIQSMTGHLITSLRGVEDDRISVAYLMLLSVWLFEDVDAVNDLLSEASTIQSIVQAAFNSGKEKEVVQGLCVFLLGIIYEFSTKDSPISRRKLQPILLTSLGREQYVSKINLLREHQLVRDFEVLSQGLAGAIPGNLPDVYFDQLFVDFLKDTFSRLRRAIDRDPGKEFARIHEGVDRDLLDSLQSQIKHGQESLQRSESDILSLQGKLGQEQADHRRSQERFNAELLRIKNVNEALQLEHDADLEQMRSGHQEALQRQKEQHDRKVQDLEGATKRSKEESASQSKIMEDQHQSKAKLLQNRISELDVERAKSKDTIEKLRQTNEALTKKIKDKDGDIEAIRGEKRAADQNVDFQIQAADNLKELLKGLEERVKESGSQLTALQVQLNKKEEARLAAQTELDDMLIILGDLEEKRANDKKKLKELGASVSDDEDDGDDEEDAAGEIEHEDEALDLNATDHLDSETSLFDTGTPVNGSASASLHSLTPASASMPFLKKDEPDRVLLSRDGSESEASID